MTRHRMPRYSDLSLRVKLLAPFLVVMVVWGGVGSYVLARGAVGDAHARATVMLAQSLDAARGAFADTERALIETVRLSTNTRGVGSALARGDRKAIHALLAPISITANAFISVVRPDGSVVDRIDHGRQISSKGARFDYPAVLKAARGAADDLGPMWSGLTRDSFLVAGPVRDGSGRLVGAVVASERLERIATRMSRGSSGGVTIFSQAGSVLVSSSVVPVPYRATVDGVEANALVGGKHYEVLYAPFESRGVRVGELGVAVASSTAFGSAHRTALVLAILAGAAAALVALIGLLSARSVTRPLRRLGDTAQAMERGDLGARVSVRSRDEVGRLAATFDRMASELEASHRGLEEKVAERTAELERLNEELKRASAAKSAFVATMSHELRTPLHAINGFAEMLSDPMFGKPSLKTTRELGGNIVTSGKHLLTLINDILDLARVEAGRIEIHLQHTDLAAVMKEVLAIVRPLADQKHLRLSMSEAGGCVVVADPARLRQVLFNLVANAIKFSSDRGKVDVRIDPSEHDVTVSVTDNGPGLAPGEATRIFEPFERGHASRKTEGAGLGLTLARHLVELQGGRIWVESRRGHGSTFSFTVPVATGVAREARTIVETAGV